MVDIDLLYPNNPFNTTTNCVDIDHREFEVVDA